MVKLQRKAALDHFNEYARMDRWSRLYDEIDNPVNFSFLIRRQRVLELLGDLSDKRVLDIGCGTGVFFQDLIEQGGRIVGADGAVEMIHTARSRSEDLPGDRICLSVSIIEQLGFRSDTFDAVICVGVIEYVENQEEAIRELIRVLKPGGMLVVTVPNAACLDLWIKRMLSIPRWMARTVLKGFGVNMGDGKDVDRRYYTPRQLDALVETCGGAIADRVFYFLDVWCYPLRLISPRLSLWSLQRVEPHHRVRGLRWFARGYIVKART